MKGGNRDQFFLSLLEYYPDEKRWFLNSLLQVKDEGGISGDEAIRSWINRYENKANGFRFSPDSSSLCHL